jgi:hypothetical protein
MRDRVQSGVTELYVIRPNRAKLCRVQPDVVMDKPGQPENDVSLIPQHFQRMMRLQLDLGEKSIDV